MVDYAKLREAILDIISRPPYVPTDKRENLTDHIIAVIKDQLEPKVSE